MTKVKNNKYTHKGYTITPADNWTGTPCFDVKWCTKSRCPGYLRADTLGGMKSLIDREIK